MKIPVSLRIDFASGAGPGQITATALVLGPDGTVYDSGEAVLVTAGQSLTVPDLHAEVTLGSHPAHGPTPKPKPAPVARPGAKPAA